MAKRTSSVKRTQESAHHAERQRQALELRKAGHSFDSIAEKLGYSNRSAANKAVRAALAEITAEPAEEVRKLEIERLDGLYQRAMQLVDDKGYELDDEGLVVAEVPANARVAAIGQAVRVGERRAKLLGLDAAEKHEHSGTVSTIQLPADRGEKLRLLAQCLTREEIETMLATKGAA